METVYLKLSDQLVDGVVGWTVSFLFVAVVNEYITLERELVDLLSFVYFVSV